jgi:hypothetical protein
MMKEANILAEERKLQTNQTSTNKETTPPPAEKRSTAPPKDIPVKSWIMPPEQHGYIQANDKDCL